MRRSWRWWTPLVVLLLAAPEGTWVLTHLSDPGWVAGGLGLLAGGEGTWVVVVVAATVPAAVVVSDRRDGLVLLLRLRGLRPVGYLAMRAGVAALQAALLAVAGMTLALVALVAVIGAGPSGQANPLALNPLTGDVHAILATAVMAAGLAAIAAVVGSVVQVPVVPNLIPLAGFVAASWLAGLLPGFLGELAGAASGQQVFSGLPPVVNLWLPPLVWPAIAALSVAVVGPRQESLWRR